MSPHGMRVCRRVLVVATCLVVCVVLGVINQQSLRYSLRAATAGHGPHGVLRTNLTSPLTRTPPFTLPATTWRAVTALTSGDLADHTIRGLPLNGSSTPKKNIVFIKVHKAASSAVQNVLHRYAWLRPGEVTVALSRSNIFLGWPSTFRLEHAMAPPAGGYNIFCQHSRYSPTSDVRLLMPRDALYVAILRDPVHQFESQWNYYGINKSHRVTYQQFLNDTAGHMMGATRPAPGDYKPVHPQLYPLRNPQTFDLGGVEMHPFHASHAEVNSTVSKTIAFIDKDFDLVMIAERFQESLILLGHVMGWSLADLVVFSKNTRAEQYKQTDEQIEANRELAVQWNTVDNILYKYYKSKLERHIAWYGAERMREEVARLNQMKDAAFQDCVADTVTRNQKIWDRLAKSWSPQVSSFVLRPDRSHNATCQALTWSENGLTLALKRRQWPLLHFTS